MATTSSIKTPTEAYQFLAGFGLVQPGKKYTDPYLLRKARSIEKQVVAGQEPSVSVARGHSDVRISYHKKDRHALEHYLMQHKPKKSGATPEFTMHDFRELWRQARGKIQQKNNYLIVICGYPATGSDPDTLWQQGMYRCYSGAFRGLGSVERWMESHRKSSFYDFASFATGDIPWDSITTVSIAFPEPKSKK